MHLAGKKRNDLSPSPAIEGGAGNKDIYKVWWAYERAYDNVGWARFWMLAGLAFGLLGFILLQTERHENDVRVQAAKQEAAIANARVLKLVDKLPAALPSNQ